MFTLKNISLKPILFLFLLTPLLISAQSISADSLKTKKKTKFEISFGKNPFFLFNSIPNELKLKNNILYNDADWGISLIDQERTFLYDQYNYNEITFKINRLLFILSRAKGGWLTSNQIPLEGTSINLLSYKYNFSTYKLHFGYEKEFPLMTKHIKGLSFDVGVLGMIGISKRLSTLSNYSFFDNDNNQITSEEVKISDDDGTLFHNSGYASFKRTQNKFSSNHFNAGLTTSFALSYKLTEQFGLRIRQSIGVEKFFRDKYENMVFWSPDGGGWGSHSQPTTPYISFSTRISAFFKF